MGGDVHAEPANNVRYKVSAKDCPLYRGLLLRCFYLNPAVPRKSVRYKVSVRYRGCPLCRGFTVIEILAVTKYRIYTKECPGRSFNFFEILLYPL